MLILKNEVTPVEIDGVIYKLTKPKNKDVELLMSFSDSENKDSQFSQGIKFLVNSGIPEDIVKNLDVELTAVLIDHLLPEKKN